MKVPLAYAGCAAVGAFLLSFALYADTERARSAAVLAAVITFAAVAFLKWMLRR